MRIFKPKNGFWIAVLLVCFTSTTGAQILEEITVTAQKRDQSITDVSIAINAFTSEDVRSFRIEDPTDIADLVSNMDIKGTLGGVNPAITIRGVGLNDFNANNNPSVGVYIDEIFLSSPAMLNVRMFDVERVEVLKGPQGTLYGRNSTGGAINVINRKPTQEFDSYFSLGKGNFDQMEVEAAFGGGLSATTAGRVSISHQDQGDSYHHNLLTGSDMGGLKSTAGRAQLEFNPSDSIRGNISIHFGNAKGANTPFTIFGLLDPSMPANADWSVNLCGPAKTFKFDDSQCSDFFGIQETDDDNPYTHSFNSADAAKYIVDTDYVGAVVRLEHDVGDSSIFTSITGFESQDRVYGDNINSHPFQLSAITHDEEISQFSQEFRLSGSSNDGKQWIFGVFFSKDEFESKNVFESTDFFLTHLFWDNDQETTSWAIFGSRDWQLSETLSLTAGFRYTDEKIDFTGGTTDLNPFDMSCIIDPFCLPTGYGAVPITFVDDKLSDNDISVRVALEYRPSDDKLIYGSVSTGYKSGGFFGDFTFSDSELAPFRSETITAYEIGSKSTRAEGRVQLNASVFYYDYDDMQTLVPGVLVTAFANAGDSEITGLDLDILAVPRNGLTLGLGLGLIDAKLGAIGIFPAGNKSPNTADLQVNGFISYEFEVRPGITMGWQSNFKYTDDMFRDAFNFTESYTTVDARIWLASDDDKWEVALWAKNLTDEEYTENAFNFVDLTGLANHMYGPPRTYGINFTYFGGK
jgi:iron complex outermembrane receptor protein